MRGPALPAALLLALVLPALAPPAEAATRAIDLRVGTNPDGSMYLLPAEVSAPRQFRVLLNITNRDGVAHDIALLGLKDESVRVQLAPRAIGQGSFIAKDAGTYELSCQVPGHKEKGMRGTLVVEGDPAGVPGPPLALALAALGCAALVARARRW
jgi:plastocyanin